MKNLAPKNFRPSKKAAIFANWFRVGVIGLLALPSVFHLIVGVLPK